jgi:hypothetical protein
MKQAARRVLPICETNPIRGAPRTNLFVFLNFHETGSKPQALVRAAAGPEFIGILKFEPNFRRSPRPAATA